MLQTSSRGFGQTTDASGVNQEELLLSTGSGSFEHAGDPVRGIRAVNSRGSTEPFQLKPSQLQVDRRGRGERAPPVSLRERTAQLERWSGVLSSSRLLPQSDKS